MPNGLFNPKDIKRLEELGDTIREAFSHEIPATCEKIADSADGRCIYEIRLSEPTTVRYVVLQEDLNVGQRVESFEIRAQAGEAFRGTTIGHKRICADTIDYLTDTLHLVITSARGPVALRSVHIYR